MTDRPGADSPGEPTTDATTRPDADRLLVARMAAGDDRALAALYDRYAALVYSIALAIVGDAADAEEVAADAFLQVWRSADSFDAGRSSVAAWLGMITRSRALDRLRSRRRRGQALERAAAGEEEGLALPLAAEEAPDRSAELGDVRQSVSRALQTLPPPQRRVIELAYFQGLSQSQIATELKEPLGTVKTRMRAGMDKLRVALETYLIQV